MALPILRQCQREARGEIICGTTQDLDRCALTRNEKPTFVLFIVTSSSSARRLAVVLQEVRLRCEKPLQESVVLRAHMLRELLGCVVVRIDGRTPMATVDVQANVAILLQAFATRDHYGSQLETVTGNPDRVLPSSKSTMMLLISLAMNEYRHMLQRSRTLVRGRLAGERYCGVM